MASLTQVRYCAIKQKVCSHFNLVFAGEMNGTPVAIKFVQNSTMFKREYKCYEQMGATSSKDCEKFGTVYIYHTDTILDYSTMVMTKLDTKVLSARSKTDSFSDDTILIIFRDMVRRIFLLKFHYI